jgi:O-antigen/teichoic acid export membrane protein
MGRTRDVFTIRCWQTGTSLAFAMLAAPFGFFPIILALTASIFISAPIAYLYMSRALAIEFPTLLSRLWKPFVSAGIFAGTASVIYFKAFQPYGIIGLSAALVVAYAVFCVCFYCWSGEEIKLRIATLFTHLRRRHA